MNGICRTLDIIGYVALGTSTVVAVISFATSMMKVDSNPLDGGNWPSVLVGLVVGVLFLAFAAGLRTLGRIEEVLRAERVKKAIE